MNCIGQIMHKMIPSITGMKESAKNRSLIKSFPHNWKDM